MTAPEPRMGHARLVERLVGRHPWQREGGVYQVDPPMEWGDMAEGEGGLTEYVLVSAADVPPSGPETYIFAVTYDADSGATPLSHAELPGSYRGGLDHAEAFRGAGYEIGDVRR